MTHTQSYPFPEDACKIEGMFYITPKKNSARKFSFKKIPLPALPEHHLLEGKRIREVPDYCGNGRIYLNTGVYKKLTQELELSVHVENGGYLLGNAYRFPGSPENENDPNFKWWISIDHIIPAQSFYGTPGMLLFTGDSWSHIHRLLDRKHKDLKLLGWYHTHLFDATPEMGLSSMDLDLHRRFLPLPWQIALLINIQQNNDRIIRCFQKSLQNVFLEMPYYDLD
jgi:hypothetical protein